MMLAMTLPPGSLSAPWLTTFEWLKRPYDVLDLLRSRYGEAFSFKLAGAPVFACFSAPDAIRDIFTEPGDRLHAGEFNQVLAPLLGKGGVLMVDGRPHSRKRRLLMPPFQGERMQAYGQTMLDFTDEAIARQPKDRPFSLHEMMQDITLRVIIRTIYGIAGGPEFDAMVERTKRLLALGAWPPLLLPVMQHEVFGLTPYGRFKAASREADAAMFADIDARRRSGVRGDDILSMLLDARDEDGAPMSAEELRDELVTLLVAGHETTATALTWAFRWLLRDRALFAEAKAEARALGDDAHAITKSEYFEHVAREALRLVPVLPMVGRLVKEPYRVGGYELPVGSVACASIYLAHRRPETYDSPTRFDPHRFARKKFGPFEFLPFGGGSRRCLGAAFALYEMKVVLSRMLKKTDLTLRQNEPIAQVRRSITIAPAEGLQVSL